MESVFESIYEARQHTVREIEELTGVKKATLYWAIADMRVNSSLPVDELVSMDSFRLTR